jgi:hypothetical protein
MRSFTDNEVEVWVDCDCWEVRVNGSVVLREATAGREQPPYRLALCGYRSSFALLLPASPPLRAWQVRTKEGGQMEGIIEQAGWTCAECFTSTTARATGWYDENGSGYCTRCHPLPAMDPHCPQGHSMAHGVGSKDWPPDLGRSCDGCDDALGEKIDGYFTCRTCEHDLCMGCAFKQLRKWLGLGSG